MNLSGVKLIATDMDGTLLNSKKQLSESFYNIFDKLKAKGILFAAASGRQLYNLQNEFLPVKNDMIFIGENGSFVTYKDEELLVQPLDKAIVPELIRIARTIPDAYTILCGKKQAYIEDTNEDFMKNVEMYYDRRTSVDDLLKVTDDEILKIAICDFGGSEQNSYIFYKQFEGELQVKVSGNIWLDISDKMANKGRAIKALQKRFNIGFDETMVFGDYMNDLEMMKEAYFSYAVENAHPEIKEAARFITTSNDEDGVVKVLEELLNASLHQTKK